jgi:branched-chain amino acid transport system permease protein
MYTGLAGSLGAITVQFVAPDSFGVFVSIFLFVGLIVGGASSIGGTLIGAAFIEFIPNLADKVSKAAPSAVYGALLIGVMFLLPAGAGGLLTMLWRKLTHSNAEQIGGAPEVPGLEYEDDIGLRSLANPTHKPVATHAADKSPAA